MFQAWGNAEDADKFNEVHRFPSMDSQISTELPKRSNVILTTGHPFSPRTAGISGVIDI